MNSEYFIVQSIIILNFCFDQNFTRLTTAAIVHFSLVSTETVSDMKNIFETENQFLYKTAPLLISTVYEKEVAGHCPRYFRANIML